MCGTRMEYVPLQTQTLRTFFRKDKTAAAGTLILIFQKTLIVDVSFKIETNALDSKYLQTN